MASDNSSSDAGIERLFATVRANPRSTAFVSLGHALCDAGRTVEAEEVARDGLLQHPRLVSGQVVLGRALLEKGRPREAQDVLIEAARANPESGEVFRWLGAALLRKGDVPRARPILEYAEELLPGDAGVGDLLTRSGGKPYLRAPRPRSDFEHTRVTDARVLADEMYDEAPTPEPVSVGNPFAATNPGHEESDNEATVVAASSLLTDSASHPLAANPPVGSPVWGAATVKAPYGKALALLARPSAPAITVRAPVSFVPLSPGLALAAVAAPKTRNPVLLGVILVALGGAGFAFLRFRDGGTAAPDLRPGLLQALHAGTPDDLRRVLTLGAQQLRADPTDGATAGRMAFATALLFGDYGHGSAQDVRDALAKAQQTGSATLSRTGFVDATRALLALALQQGDDAAGPAKRAVAAAPELDEVRVALARVRVATGDLEGARADLERALAHSPHFAAAVADWTLLWVDLADATAAVTSARSFLGLKKIHPQVSLALAESERSAGMSSAPSLAAACGAQVPPGLAAACALGRAAIARLSGDRTTALRETRLAITEPGASPRVRAQAVVLLALLGDKAAATAEHKRLSDSADRGFLPLFWAGVAVSLAHGARVESSPFLSRPISPETRLLAVRAALATGGASAADSVLRGFGPGLIAADRHLKALADSLRIPGSPQTKKGSTRAPR